MSEKTEKEFELIKQFMGYRDYNANGKLDHFYVQRHLGIGTELDRWETLGTKGSEHFDSSWIWLMPVARQLDEILYTLLSQQNDGKHELLEEWLSEVSENIVFNNNQLMVSVNLESSYVDIVKSIEWYNKHKDYINSLND